MEITYKTKGTCSRAIKVLLAPDHTIEEVVFTGGCDGNLSGIASLARGRKAEEVIACISGMRCGAKETSCPDQLAIALREAIEKQNEEAAD